MKKLVDYFFKLLEFLVVLCLFAMVVMVFGNVVMRYAFNSGILMSEEMSRYCFIWLTYLGAMIAMREGGHLGVDTLIKKLPLLGKKVCVFLSESLMLFCNVLFLWGTYQMHDLQVTNISPVAGLSMIWVYGIGYLVAVVMGAFNVEKIYRLVTGQLAEHDMLAIVEAEGLKEAEEQIQKAQSAPNSSGAKA
ncbi:MAG: TRAP transporter small permease [Burkholderiales bacterium]|nr:MAG: TRAP transporter small permease [Betaproteobacteria bacterium]TAG24105.1 MAG: TRAP transporter small permease [Burkholderiales bacterium]